MKRIQRLKTRATKHQLPTRYQRGAVLIVSLVMLAILTIIAVGTTTDIGFQMNMARNNQVSLQAFNVALSELRAQNQASKTNSQIGGVSYLQMFADVRESDVVTPIDDADLLMPSVDNPFTQIVAIEYIGHDVLCDSGNGVGSTIIFEIHSTATLANAINSNQTFGFCYPDI